MASDFEPTSAPGPFNRAIAAIAPWPWLLGGLVMLAGVWLMPAIQQHRELMHKRDLVAYELSQSNVKVEVKQQLASALQAGDPVLLERLACNYMGMRPSGVEVVSEPAAQLVNNPAAGISVISAIPVRETWQDLVEQSTAAQLAVLPPVVAQLEPDTTLLHRLTMGNGRVPLLLLAAFCLWVGLRPQRSEPVEVDVVESPEHVAKWSWLDQFGQQPEIAYLGGSTSESSPARTARTTITRPESGVTKPQRLQRPARSNSRSSAATMPAVALDNSGDSHLGTGLLRTMEPQSPIDIEEGWNEFNTTFDNEVEDVIDHDFSGFSDDESTTEARIAVDWGTGFAYHSLKDVDLDDNSGLTDAEADLDDDLFNEAEARIEAEVSGVNMSDEDDAWEEEESGSAEVEFFELDADLDLSDIPSHPGDTESSASGEGIDDDLPASTRQWFQGGNNDGE